MAFKWTDTTERMMLIKFLEQHQDAKLDAAAALEAWPTDLASPTSRSITDRFNGLKRQIKQSKLTNTLGIGATTSHIANAVATSASPSIPRTPRSQPNKRAKTNHDHITGAASCPPLNSGSPYTAKGVKNTSSAIFKSKLQAAAKDTKASKKRKRNGKAKGKGSESEEDSMSSDESDAESNTEVMDEPTKSTGSRRSLPRRSKSMTPGTTYRVDDATESEDEDESDGEEQERGRVSRGQAKGKGSQGSSTEGENEGEDESQDEEGGDSDDLFDPSVHHAGAKEDHGSKKKGKETWRDRIARVDRGDVDEDDDDDMQD